MKRFDEIVRIRRAPRRRGHPGGFVCVVGGDCDTDFSRFRGQNLSLSLGAVIFRFCIDRGRTTAWWPRTTFIFFRVLLTGSTCDSETVLIQFFSLKYWFIPGSFLDLLSETSVVEVLASSSKMPMVTGAWSCNRSFLFGPLLLGTSLSFCLKRVFPLVRL